MSQPKQNDLLKRSITGALFVLVVTGCVYWRYEAALILFGVFNVVALYEYLQLTGKISGNETVNYVTLFFMSLPYNVLILGNYWHYKTELLLCLVLIPIILMGASMLGKEKKYVTMGLWLGGLSFVSVPFFLLALFWIFDPFTGYDWRNIFAVLTLVWVNDTMAYVTGRLLGKNKLAPDISPGKTVEGFIGGIFFAGMTGLIWAYSLNGSYPYWMLAGMTVGVAATIGDLAESLLKRTAGVKDSGKIFPGHGGVLDRFDGFMAAIPVLLIFRILQLI